MKKNLIKAIAIIAAFAVLSGASIYVSADDSDSTEVNETVTLPADGTMPSPPADGEMPEMPTDGTMPSPPADGEMGTPPDGNMRGKELEEKTESSYFSDLSSYTWAIAQIDYLHENGIVNGTSDTEYSPASTMKRGDFVLMLTRQFSLTEGTADDFSDVSSDTYYYDAVMLAKANGIIDGDSFDPEAAITREDAMEMIYRALKLTGLDENMVSTDLSAYSDADLVSADKAEAVATLSNLGIIQGSGGMFNPQNNMTRAEMAVVFYNVSSFTSRMGGGRNPGDMPTDMPTDMPAEDSTSTV